MPLLVVDISIASRTDANRGEATDAKRYISIGCSGAVELTMFRYVEGDDHGVHVEGDWAEREDKRERGSSGTWSTWIATVGEVVFPAFAFSGI